MEKLNIKDLRIGNLFCGKDFPQDAALPIISISDSNIIIFKNYREPNKQLLLDELEPIKINSNWLFKFGFKKYEDVIDNDYEHYDRYVLEEAIDKSRSFEVHIIYSSHGGKKYTIDYCYSIGKSNRFYVKDPEFIHTLQNTFLLFSGNELKLK